MAFATLILAGAIATHASIAVPPVFVSTIHNVTFRAPARGWACPLTDDWVGSDHGTTVFLTRPKGCAPQGYPSSGRNISDTALVPAIDVFYAYDVGQDWSNPCHATAGRVRLFGKLRPLCREDVPGGIQLFAQAGFMGDEPSFANVTLTTTPARLAIDLPAFRALAASLRACRSLWPAQGKFKAEWLGRGAKCPRDGQFF
jgi:hypothetical protein